MVGDAANREVREEKRRNLVAHAGPIAHADRSHRWPGIGKLLEIFLNKVVLDLLNFFVVLAIRLTPRVRVGPFALPSE